MQLGASHTPSSHLLLSANQAGGVDSSFQMRQLSPERGGDLSQVAQCPDHPRVLPDSEACGPSVLSGQRKGVEPPVLQLTGCHRLRGLQSMWT